MHKAYVGVDAESPLLDVAERIPVKKHPSFIRSQKAQNLYYFATLLHSDFTILPVLHAKRFHKVSNN